MLDIVINYMLMEYEWFKEVCKFKDNFYRDYYFFRLFEDGLLINWYFKFGGNVWKYDFEIDEYYLYLFDVS